MPYQPFHEKFPEIAKRETRSMTIINTISIPSGEYGLIEAYCNEPGCDCRRVFFNVLSRQTQQIVAVIAYGWESEVFYSHWHGSQDLKIIRELQGPILNLMNPQSDFAPALLEKVKLVLKDKRYIARLKRHYRLFKEAVNLELPVENVRLEDRVNNPQATSAIDSRKKSLKRKKKRRRRKRSQNS